MKKYLFIIGIALFAAVASKAQTAKHVVLVSIDGLRPEFYKDTSWPAPNLQRLMRQGVYADAVKSVFPSVTYPSHTTMVTGALPARHGIYYNAPYGGKKGQWYWEENQIKTPTLWDAVKEAGLTSGAVMWPVTVGAPIHYNFPVRRADDDEKTDQLTVTIPYITPAGLINEIQQRATGPLTQKDFNGNDQIDVTIGKMASYIFKTYRPNLMAIHFITVDHRSHQFGRDGEKVRSAVALVDSMLGIVLQSVTDAGLQNSTAVIITGDHGFVNSEKVFAPNVLLAQHGLLSNGQWQAKFHTSGGGAFLYLKNKNDKNTLDKVKQILNNLHEDQKKLFRLVERPELDRAGANPEVALALAMSKGAVAQNDLTGEIFRTKKKAGSHGYFPDFDEIHTGFIATGAGIGNHRSIPLMGIQDIAPLVAALLNLPFTSPDGKIVPGILATPKKKS